MVIVFSIGFPTPYQSPSLQEQPFTFRPTLLEQRRLMPNPQLEIEFGPIILERCTKSSPPAWLDPKEIVMLHRSPPKGVEKFSQEKLEKSLNSWYPPNPAFIWSWYDISAFRLRADHPYYKDPSKFKKKSTEKPSSSAFPLGPAIILKSADSKHPLLLDPEELVYFYADYVSTPPEKISKDVSKLPWLGPHKTSFFNWFPNTIVRLREDHPYFEDLRKEEEDDEFSSR